MEMEWNGQVAEAGTVKAGTCALFALRNATHLGVMAIDERARGAVKGIVSLTHGYDGHAGPPAFFDLSALGASSIVYALPDVRLAIPTDRNHIHPGRHSVDYKPGSLAQEGNDLFLATAYNSGIRFLNLTTGAILNEWSPSESIVWFSSWSIVRRLGETSRSLLDFDQDKRHVT